MLPIPILAATGGLLYVGARKLRSPKRPAFLDPIYLEEPSDPSPSTPEPLPASSPTMLAGMKEQVQQAAGRVVDTLAGRERQAHLASLQGEANDLATTNPAEQQAQLYMAISLACLGVTTAGSLFFPPLVFLSVPGLLYTAYPFMKMGWDDLREKRQVSATTLDLISIPGATVTGNLFAASLAVSLLSLSDAVLKRTEDQSLQSMVNVFGQQPATVWTVVDGVETERPFAELQAGDILVVTAGQMIAADGVIMEGVAAVDQRMLTGESQPSEKTRGDEVFAASLVLAGRVLVQVERAGQATIAAKIGEILAQTADYKEAFASRSQALANWWTLPTLAAAGVALPLYGFGGGIAILLSSLGYNLRIVGPLSMLNFLRLAARQGILVKDARALELLHTVDTVVFDKTGTLTLEQPQVQQIYPYHGWSESTVLAYAAAAESRQTHPIARAILAAAKAQGVPLPAMGAARYEVGYGLTVMLDDHLVRVGSERFMEMEAIAVPAAVTALRTTAHAQGHSLVLVSCDDRLVGAIELAPTVRPEARRLIDALHQRGLALSIISGDQEQPTRHLAGTLGIEHYFANTLPEHKADLLKELQQQGKRVCFIGDGINDAIALKQADVSISLRGASTIATDTAQIVLMDAALDQLLHLFELTEAYEANMRVNHVASLAPGLLVIGGVFLFNFGVLTSIMIYNAGLVAGVVNAMTPLLGLRPPSATPDPAAPDPLASDPVATDAASLPLPSST
ncbi:MAG: heavy metal translocating P-type ATPase [Caldilineaceae bacterium]|nr:heavy metal translocating P-type ATPase [Caldilineaceae bacterium]